MALRNHALDEAILDAARDEFLLHGFEAASLRKIAASAGVTIGAIHTRYPTKNQLFGALVQPLIDRIGKAFELLRSSYAGVTDPAGLLRSMELESDTILELLFDCYDQAVLLLCRSRGSSLEPFWDELIRRKTDETISFFRAAGLPHPDEQVLRMMVEGQFHSYFQIIREGYDLPTAKTLMTAAVRYHTAGWMAILQMDSEESGR